MQTGEKQTALLAVAGVVTNNITGLAKYLMPAGEKHSRFALILVTKLHLHAKIDLYAYAIVFLYPFVLSNHRTKRPHYRKHGERSVCRFASILYQDTGYIRHQKHHQLTDRSKKRHRRRKVMGIEPVQ